MSSTDSEVEPCASGYTRKRRENTENWEKTKAKHARNKGETYTSYTTKQQVPARVVGPPCKCGCFDKIGLHKIKEIFSRFWAIGDFNQQNAYLSKFVNSAEVKHSRVKDRPSRQLRRINYAAMHQNNLQSVCRFAFYSMHGITEKRVRTVLNKRNSTGVVEPDKRGQALPSTKVSDE